MSENNVQPEQNQGQVEDQSQPAQPSQTSEAQKKKNKKVLIIVGIVVGVLIILSIVGTLVSGWIAKTVIEKGIETATGGKVKIDTGNNGGSLEIKGDNNDSIKTDVGSNVKLPDGFPSYVPIYANAKLESASVYTDDDNEKSFSVSYSSTDSLDKIFQFFEQEITQDNGFKVDSSSIMSSGLAIITATYQTNGSNLSVSVTSSDSDNSRTILYIYRENRE